MSRPSTIRKLTRLIKGLYPTLRRIPRALPRPGNQDYLAPQGVDTKTRQSRQEAFELADSRRLDKETVRFFAEPFGNEGRGK